MHIPSYTIIYHHIPSYTLKIKVHMHNRMLANHEHTGHDLTVAWIWNIQKSFTGCWFGTFFIFPYIGNNHPNWLSYFSEGFKQPTRFKCPFFFHTISPLCCFWIPLCLTGCSPVFRRTSCGGRASPSPPRTLGGMRLAGSGGRGSMEWQMYV